MNKKCLKILFLFASLFFTTSVFAITIESKKQEIDLEKNKGYFTGDVKVQVGDVVVTSPKADLDIEPATKKPSLATFIDKPYAHQIKGNKKHEVKADIIKVSLINKIVTAQGNAQTNVLKDAQPIIIITADTQEYDTNTNLMKATGSVVINYEDVTATSDVAYALMDKNGDVQNIKLSSRAIIKQDKNIIKGDTIQYSAKKQDIVATGNTMSDLTFKKGDRVVVTARSQQYDRKSNMVMASGNVCVKSEKYVAVGPKALMYMDAITNKPKKIIFIGRSKITESGVNSVEADKITMYVKPQKFDAEGNVKTVIDQDQAGKDNNGSEFNL